MIGQNEKEDILAQVILEARHACLSMLKDMFEEQWIVKQDFSLDNWENCDRLRLQRWVNDKL